jgi:hypothetical protein
MNVNPGLEEMFLVTEVISGVCVAREFVQFSRWKDATAELRCLQSAQLRSFAPPEKRLRSG